MMSFLFLVVISSSKNILVAFLTNRAKIKDNGVFSRACNTFWHVYYGNVLTGSIWEIIQCWFFSLNPFHYGSVGRKQVLILPIYTPAIYRIIHQAAFNNTLKQISNRIQVKCTWNLRPPWASRFWKKKVLPWCIHRLESTSVEFS